MLNVLMRRWRLLPAVAAVVAVVAIASYASGAPFAAPPAAQATSAGAPGTDGIDWVPFADPLVVPALPDALARAGFAAVVPAVIGKPKLVYLHESYRPQALGLVFDAPFGHFMLVEDESGLTRDAEADTLRALVRQCERIRCGATWLTHRFRDGNTAVLAAGSRGGVNSIIWFHDGIRFQLFGPVDELPLANAVALATAIELAG